MVPTNMQSDSVDVNRMRSCYIKTIITVWQKYGKAVTSGISCPVFGTYTAEGEVLLSRDLAEAV